MSKNSADTSLRIFNSIRHYGLNISRAALVGGVVITPYLGVFKTDLFLSANESDVQEAINANIAARIICSHDRLPISPEMNIEQILIAFDGMLSYSLTSLREYIGKAAWKHFQSTNRKMQAILYRKVHLR